MTTNMTIMRIITTIMTTITTIMKTKVTIMTTIITTAVTIITAIMATRITTIATRMMATSRHFGASRSSRDDTRKLLPRFLGGGVWRRSRGLILSTVTRARHHYSSIFNKPRGRQEYMEYLGENGSMPTPP